MRGIGTIVYNCVGGEDTTVYLTHPDENQPIRFSLPFDVALETGDKLKFYDGQVNYKKGRNHPQITHEDYCIVTVTKGNSNKEFILLHARDMDLLTYVKQNWKERKRYD